MHVLLVEDDEKLGRIICQVLKKENFDVDWAQDSDDAFAFVDYCADNIYDVIILDWMLPGKSGPEICKTLRDNSKYNYQGGIIFLTARDALEDRIAGLNAGGDDYLVKPFENAELVARLNALYRRKGRPYVDNTLKFNDIELNRNEQIVTYKSQQIQFSKREFAIFDLLLINAGRVLPRDTIIKRIWGNDSEVTSANLDSYIYLLRKKIKLLEPVLSISLVRGVGYKIEKKNDKQTQK